MQYKLNNKLSVERIVRALNSCKCLIEEDETIKVLQNETVIAYKENSLSYDEVDQILQDYFIILEAYKVEIPFERYKKNNFTTFLRKIRY